MHTNYATINNYQAYLSSSFGQQLAQLWFGLDNDMLASLVGRISRGKRKGQLRGQILWSKCTRGGWQHSEYGDGGHVVFPGLIRARLVLISGFGRNETMETLLTLEKTFDHFGAKKWEIH